MVDEFLSSSQIIDFDHPQVQIQARLLKGNTKLETCENCFCFVRDRIEHSSDFQRDTITLRASEVLTAGTGYCYAKSHLLAGLLRANQIPTALCYQRLSVAPDSTRYCLHGLNAVFLEEFGWYRIDARGNRDGIHASFSPPRESLAFSTDQPGEFDLPGHYADPLAVVVNCLLKHNSWREVHDHLPDWPQEVGPPEFR